jgi:hypothetical protein
MSQNIRQMSTNKKKRLQRLEKAEDLIFKNPYFLTLSIEISTQLTAG